MGDTSENNKNNTPISSGLWIAGYCCPGVALLLLGFFTAAVAPADVIGLGGFLCFFTLGVTLIVEGTKKKFASKSSQKN